MTGGGRRKTLAPAVASREVPRPGAGSARPPKSPAWPVRSGRLTGRTTRRGAGATAALWPLVRAAAARFTPAAAAR
ncbi:hypothetical protein SAMN06272735_4509 [Streptomyces sp. TLI_55]|nr:hypothetical protein SAMN06272735_4509 [Streptomyces sp. TLI_55]